MNDTFKPARQWLADSTARLAALEDYVKCLVELVPPYPYRTDTEHKRPSKGVHYWRVRIIWDAGDHEVCRVDVDEYMDVYLKVFYNNPRNEWQRLERNTPCDVVAQLVCQAYAQRPRYESSDGSSDDNDSNYSSD